MQADPKFRMRCTLKFGCRTGFQEYLMPPSMPQPHPTPPRRPPPLLAATEDGDAFVSEQGDGGQTFAVGVATQAVATLPVTATAHDADVCSGSPMVIRSPFIAPRLRAVQQQLDRFDRHALSVPYRPVDLYVLISSCCNLTAILGTK